MTRLSILWVEKRTEVFGGNFLKFLLYSFGNPFQIVWLRGFMPFNCLTAGRDVLQNGTIGNLYALLYSNFRTITKIMHTFYSFWNRYIRYVAIVFPCSGIGNRCWLANYLHKSIGVSRIWKWKTWSGYFGKWTFLSKQRVDQIFQSLPN